VPSNRPVQPHHWNCRVARLEPARISRRYQQCITVRGSAFDRSGVVWTLPNQTGDELVRISIAPAKGAMTQTARRPAPSAHADALSHSSRGRGPGLSSVVGHRASRQDM
jgi:hypothetical protein